MISVIQNPIIIQTKEKTRVTTVQNAVGILDPKPIVNYIRTEQGGGTTVLLNKDVLVNYTSLTAPFSLGEIPKDKIISEVRVIVGTAFDNGILTIGDDDAQGRLVNNSDIDILSQGTYVVLTNIKYNINTEIKVYYTGTSTKGQLRIIILYQ